MSLVLPTVTGNPFVGPRAFETGERLYARDRETRRIVDLLIAERIVLLYSPSGAGKTSLINAALVPALTEERFQVSPSVRVGMEVSHGTPLDRNRYALSTLLSLEEGLPAARRRDEEELATVTLDAYLRTWGELDDVGAGNELLIFDQFEEILTADPSDEAGRRAFFEELGHALRDRGRWALFAMREEYLAGLDPYLGLLPTKLRTRVRLDLLTEAAAVGAIQKPAASAGREITDDAAHRLVDELRLVNVQRGGQRRQLPGPVVEPVQLQVVCSRLWDAVGPGVTRIGTEHVDALGDVEQALGAYYAEKVATVAGAAGVQERLLRDWFDEELITASGFRAQLPHGPRSVGDADATVLRMLEDAHLVRAEDRRGTRWFELAHDRLVEPVRADNARWRAEHLSYLQRQAASWHADGRSEELLLSGRALDDAEARIREGADELTDLEREFYEACLAARRARRRQRRTTTITWVSIVLTLALAGTVIATVVTLVQRANAETQAAMAHSRQLAIESSRLVDNEPSLARLVALEGVHRSQTPEAIASLATALTRPTTTLVDRWEQDVGGTATAFSPDGEVLASLAEDGSVLLRDTATGGSIGTPLPAHGGAITHIAFSPDGHTIATVGEDGSVQLWDAATGAPEGNLLREHEGLPLTIGFASSGDAIATGNESGSVQVWDTTTGEPHGAPMDGPISDVSSMAIGPDGRSVATADWDGAIQVWDAGTGPHEGDPMVAHDSWVTTLSFSPDGRSLASVGSEGTVQIWEMETGDPRGDRLAGHDGHEGDLATVAFSADGRSIASAGHNGTVRLWDRTTEYPYGDVMTAGTRADAVAFGPDTRLIAAIEPVGDGEVLRLREVVEQEPPLGRPLLVHEETVTTDVFAVATSPDGQLIASAGDDQVVRLWDRETGEPVGEPLVGHEDWVGAVAFDPTGEILASASDDGTIRLWGVTNGELRDRPLIGHTGGVTDVVFDPDGVVLASGSWDGTVRLWEALTGDPIGEPLTGHEDWVRAVAFDPTGQTLASASDDGTVRLWDVTTGAPYGGELRGHDGWVHAVAFSPDGKLLASAGDDGSVQLWDTDTGEPHGDPWSGHAGTVTGVTFHPDGDVVASAGDDGRVQLWEVASGQHLDDQVLEHAGGVADVVFDADGDMLISAGADGTVRLWDGATSSPLRTIEYESSPTPTPPAALAVSADGRSLATAGSDGTVQVWDASSGEALGEPMAGDAGWPVWLGFSPDGRWIAVADGTGEVQLWDVASGRPGVGPLPDSDGAVVAVAFSSDGGAIASAGASGTVRVWDVATGQPAGDAVRLDGDLSTATFSPDLRSVATVEGDGVMRRWELPSGRQLPGGADGVTATAFGPDGGSFATAAWDGTVRLWDFADGEPIGEALTGAGPGSGAELLAVGEDRVATFGWDGTVRFWGTSTGVQAGELHTSGNWEMAAFDPDANQLATVHEDGSVRIWDLDPTSWVQMSCANASRNLTLGEWNMWIGPDVDYTPSCADLPRGDGQFDPRDLDALTGADEVYGRLLVDIGAAERVMMDFNEEIIGLGWSDRAREFARERQEDLLAVRERLTDELPLEGADRIRAAYVHHLDPWADLMGDVADDPSAGGLMVDDRLVAIEETGRVFADVLETELPADVDPAIHRFAQSILDRGFRATG